MKPGDLVSITRYPGRNVRMVDVDLEYYSHNVVEPGQLGLVLSTAKRIGIVWVLVVTCQAIGWFEESEVIFMERQ